MGSETLNRHRRTRLMENRMTFPQAGGLWVDGDLRQDLCDITAGLCDIGYCPNGRRQWRNWR